MSTSASQRHFKATVSVHYAGETRDLGIFDTWEGGNISSDSTKHRRGGMGQQIVAAGPPEIDDITCSRDYDWLRDDPHFHWLSDAVGKGTITVIKVVLDDNGSTVGANHVARGKFVGYQHPEHDSDSSDFAMVTLVCAPEGSIGH